MSLLLPHSSSECHMKMKDAKLLVHKDAVLRANLILPAHFAMQKRRMRKVLNSVYHGSSILLFII